MKKKREENRGLQRLTNSYRPSGLKRFDIAVLTIYFTGTSEKKKSAEDR